MRKMEGILIVKELIVVDGHINANNKVIAPTKEKYSAKPKAIAEDYVLNDPTAEIVGDAYEVFDSFGGKRRRNVVHLELAHEIEASQGIKTIDVSALSDSVIDKPEPKKPGRKPKEKA